MIAALAWIAGLVSFMVAMTTLHTSDNARVALLASIVCFLVSLCWFTIEVCRATSIRRTP